MNVKLHKRSPRTGCASTPEEGTEGEHSGGIEARQLLEQDRGREVEWSVKKRRAREGNERTQKGNSEGRGGRWNTAGRERKENGKRGL